MSQPTLRDATRADLPAITAIYEHAVRHGTASYELEPPTLAEMGERFAALKAGGFPYIVVEEGGEILGYAYAGPFRARPAYRFIVENSIYLAPAMQGRGLGRLLLAALVERCTALGFRQMIAVIGDSPRQAGSVGLHKALGFHHVGILQDVGFKHGHWCDSLLMQRALGEGGTTKP